MMRIKEKLGSAIDSSRLQQSLVYIVVWGLVALLPLLSNLSAYITGASDSIEWGKAVRRWCELVPFLLLFIVNDRLLIPRLFYRGRVPVYVVTAIVLAIAVMLTTDALGFTSPGLHAEPDRPELSAKPQAPPAPPAEGDLPPEPGNVPPPPAEELMPTPPPDEGMTPMFLPLLGHIAAALLMMSFNVAVSLFFKSVSDRGRLRELERCKLQSELDYLKYQLSPHFFMNTLNNIHALVDIDTEKAKDTIVELSRLMRYMLYEADRPTVPLSKEIDFLKHYVRLMRLRYPESVNIELSLPEDVGEVQLPPLLFVSFIENAFKHGVNYQNTSYVHIALELKADGKIRFTCSNSSHDSTDASGHGIGLENVRKRLDLLYDERYRLDINETETRFDVSLTRPGTSEK